MLALDRIPVTVLAGESAGRSGLHLGAVGLALASGVGSWFELLRLRAALTRRMPAFHLPWRETGRLLLLAAAAGLPSALLWAVLPALHPLLLAPLVLLPYALVYLGLARFLAPEELAFWVGRFGRRLRRSS
jgi:peptidoglycan biosynthesis protein MviN/MurJ (putative lipid II flippase)